jgi:hypothetical protein
VFIPLYVGPSFQKAPSPVSPYNADLIRPKLGGGGPAGAKGPTGGGLGGGVANAGGIGGGDAGSVQNPIPEKRLEPHDMLPNIAYMGPLNAKE